MRREKERFGGLLTPVLVTVVFASFGCVVCDCHLCDCYIIVVKTLKLFCCQLSCPFTVGHNSVPKSREMTNAAFPVLLQFIVVWRIYISFWSKPNP